MDDSFVTPVKEWPTAVTFCAIKPPEDFPLYFYGRFPTAPDLQIKAEELDLDAIRDAGIFWSTVTGLCQEPSRAAHLTAHEARPRTGLKDGQFTILDLDYRPMFWASEEEAREQVARILPHVTVAIGNDKECAVAVGEGTPDEQADRLLAAGVEIAVVKLGPEGRHGQDPHRARGLRPGAGGNRQRPRRRRLLRRGLLPRTALRLAAGPGPGLRQRRRRHRRLPPVLRRCHADAGRGHLACWPNAAAWCPGTYAPKEQHCESHTPPPPPSRWTMIPAATST